MRRAHLVSLGLVLVSLATALALYAQLPDPVPTHWNLRGQPDGFMAKPLGAVLVPLIQLGVLALLAVLPLLSPRRFSIAPFVRVYARIEIAILLFLTLVNGVALTEAAGRPVVSLPRFLFGATGVLLMVLGNYLGKVTPNFFVGVRTPWTLASPEVWSRTHRLAGWLFVAGGLALLADGLIGPSLPLIFTVLSVVIVVPIAFSFLIYRRLAGTGHDDVPGHDDNS
jgi:uncharacterized membrane protein